MEEILNREFEILRFADYFEKFEIKGNFAYLIVNKNMEKYKAMFGFVELKNDFDSAEILFDRIEKRAKELGFSEIIGPVNYSTWMSYRWAISNFDLKLYPDCNNPVFYNDFIKKMGYRELYTYRSAFIDMDNPLFVIGEEVYNQKVNEGYVFKTYEGKSAYPIAKEIYDISKDAFSNSFLYSDLPYEAFEKLYLTWIKELKFSLIVAYFNGEAVGYVFGYENPVGNGFISKTSAVKKNFQKHKVYIALLYLGSKLVIDKGYEDMIYHFQCEQKDSFKKFEKKIESNEKRYAVYYKEI